MNRDLLVKLAALSAAVAIGAGAFGAHGATERAADLLRTGALYQLVHAVAVIVLAADRKQQSAAWLMLLGASVFAFSLYALAFGAPRWLGAVTPIGGVAMILGWLWVAAGRLR